MTDQELDKIMQHVLLDAIKHDYERESDDFPAFKPTRHYQRQIAAMLLDPLQWARQRARPIWIGVLQKVAVIFLVLSMSLWSLMAVSPTVRATVVRWVVEWYETHITYRFSGEQIANKMPQYEITDLPKGYAEDESERVEWPSYIGIVYRNSDNNGTIYFDYTYIQLGSASDYLTDGVEVVPVIVNGLNGQLFLTSDWENKWNTITWIDGEKKLQFEIDANLEQDAILHIAESVSLTKTGK